jgi:hypothetical protein
VRSAWVTTLTVLILIDSIGWALGVLLTLKHIFSHRTLPTLVGIRLLSGPFEALGIDAMLVAGLLFVVVSALKLLAAYWVWNLRKDGVVLQLILLALSAIFWYGFALPFGPLERSCSSWPQRWPGATSARSAHRNHQSSGPPQGL